MRTLRNSKGFTLIELMIVVVIIGILAAIAIPKFTAVSKGAKEAEAEPVLKQIRSLQDSKFLRDNAYETATIANLTGWSDPTAKFYTFSVASHASGFCAVATSKDAAVAGHRSMDATGVVYKDATCTTKL